MRYSWDYDYVPAITIVISLLSDSEKAYYQQDDPELVLNQGSMEKAFLWFWCSAKCKQLFVRKMQLKHKHIGSTMLNNF